MGRHFRIGHYRESADDGATLVAVRPQSKDWDCLICGVENHDRSHCWECSQERGTWRCDRCFHLNPGRDRECQQCGHDRPEDQE